MSEIFGAIRLKDRIIIGAVMCAFAILLAGSAGAITYASINNHAHVYDNYTLERDDGGDFYFVGTCIREGCKNPHHYISSEEFDIIEEIVTNPTCCNEGEKTFSAQLIINGKKERFTYHETEKIPALPHTYQHDGAVDLEAGSITLKCVNEGCTNTDLVIDATNEIKLESSTYGSCSAPQKDKYSYTVNGVSGSFTAIVEIEDAPHTLGGKPVSEYLIKPGIYMYGTEGIKSATNAAPLNGCGQITAGYYYKCEDCGATVQVIVGLPDHNYSQVEGSFDIADFNKAGKVTIHCSNSNCLEDKVITLPKADQSNSTLISTDELNLKQTWKYSYYSEKYDYTVEYEFETDWVHEHVFVHYPELTDKPGLYKQGKAIVKCTVDGCDAKQQIVLPKIQIGYNTANGDNSVLIIPENTEQKVQTVRYTYTYTSTQYGFTFTEVIDIEIGSKLNHSYTYHLEPRDGDFVVVARCNQPDCQTPESIKETNVEPVYSTTTTCTHKGDEIWSHPTDSSVEPFVFPSLEMGAHNLQCDLTDIVICPDLNNEGQAIAKCTNEGCTVTHEITLPKIDISEGGNSEVVLIDPETGAQLVSYTYTQVIDGVEVVVECVFAIEEKHSHEYEYELEVNDGIFVFDIVGKCTNPVCTAELRVPDVDAECIENTVSCVDPGYQTWRYVYEGVPYTCNIINFEAEGHQMNYKTDALTTIKPTFDREGSIVLFCNRCQQETRTVVLPAMIENVNATKSPEYDTKREIAYLYTYVTDDGILIELIVLLSK